MAIAKNKRMPANRNLRSALIDCSTVADGNKPAATLDFEFALYLVVELLGLNRPLLILAVAAAPLAQNRTIG